jgi:hypothetical protein
MGYYWARTSAGLRYRSALPWDDADDDGSGPSQTDRSSADGPALGVRAGHIGDIAPWAFFCTPMDVAEMRRQLLAMLARLADGAAARGVRLLGRSVCLLAPTLRRVC